jgi:hypothetical protein
MLSAVEHSSCFIADGVPYVAELTERTNAAAPAACGVDIDVPVIRMRQLPLSPNGSVLHWPAKLESNGVVVQMFSTQCRKKTVELLLSPSPPGATMPQELGLRRTFVVQKPE